MSWQNDNGASEGFFARQAKENSENSIVVDTSHLAEVAKTHKIDFSKFLESNARENKFKRHARQHKQDAADNANDIAQELNALKQRSRDTTRDMNMTMNKNLSELQVNTAENNARIAESEYNSVKGGPVQAETSEGKTSKNSTKSSPAARPSEVDKVEKNNSNDTSDAEKNEKVQQEKKAETDVEEKKSGD